MHEPWRQYVTARNLIWLHILFQRSPVTMIQLKMIKIVFQYGLVSSKSVKLKHHVFTRGALFWCKILFITRSYKSKFSLSSFKNGNCHPLASTRSVHLLKSAFHLPWSKPRENHCMDIFTQHLPFLPNNYYFQGLKFPGKRVGIFSPARILINPKPKSRRRHAVDRARDRSPMLNRVLEGSS